MAIDTAAKRSSSLDHEEPWQFCAPIPDGAIGQGDRQHSIWSYSGILAEASTVVSGPFCVVGSQYHAPGTVGAQHHSPGTGADQYHVPGSVSAQTC
jgi:hypothetical protein